MTLTRIKLKNQGQASILLVLVFAVVFGGGLIGLINPALRGDIAARRALSANQSYFLAESGIEDALYRLRYNLPLSGSQTLSFADGEATISITDTLNGKLISAEGEYADLVRKIESEVVVGAGVSFHYGVQTGTGGFILNNNAGVNGNVYANGSILGSNGAYVTGSAVSANSASLTADQVNGSPIPPGQSIIFRQTTNDQDLAQSFRPSSAGPINKVEFYLRKTGNPSNATVRLVIDNNNSPGSSVLTTGTLSAALVTGSYGWVEVAFSGNPNLEANTVYWLVIDNSTQNASNYYQSAANSSYSSGQAKVGRHGVSWNNTSPAGLDGYFKVFLGGLTGLISQVAVGSGGVGDARAHTVNSSTVAGSLHCQTGSGNNKPCNTSLPDPAPVALPVSDANIEAWKEQAVAGGTITGNYTPASSISIGPKKITGDLTVSNNKTITLAGTVWVEGNVSLSNNVQVRLDPSYGQSSGVIVVDGTVSISNNTTFFGSGQSGSYVMVLSTSNCGISPCSSSAIDVSNNAGTVILNAQKGAISFSNNAGAKAATAGKISLANNVVINYESGLASVNFVSGPSGGWNVLNWREVE